MLKNIIFVAIGGALGATLRYLFSLLLQHFYIFGVNLSTTIINIIGSLLLGATSIFVLELDLSSRMNLFLSVGIFGAFTTFSTFSKESFELIESQKYSTALVYTVVNVIFGILFYYIGRISAENILNNH
ncbi:fluoride efflux transporter CrcB [Candidatus Kapabacteria bacterium]|nr:fluoride efflux transporter CrcB [Candidatus Kapabacteria bacterium]